MPSVLLIGYGNASRRDDGVAFYIVRRIREQFGVPGTDLEEDSDEALGPGLAMICLHQLGPELAQTMADYDEVVFVDAHVEGSEWEPVHWQEIEPAYRPGMVSHHLKPQAVLALCEALYARRPRGHILSVLGTDFDFGDVLSPGTMDRAEQAVARLAGFLRAEGIVAGQADGGSSGSGGT